MPPKTQRSRACTQCRDRRVKCDESPGFCLRCTRLGLPCSGPVTLSIIDMTDKVKKPRPRKKKEIAAESNEPERQAQSSAQAGPSGDGHDEDSKPSTELVIRRDAIANMQPRHQEKHRDTTTARPRRLSELYQPSTAPIYDRSFVSHFVTHNSGIRFSSSETSWVSLLPGLHGEARNPALKLAIRAASMAFYANLHSADTILAESRRWYGTSLSSQIKAVARIQEGSTIPTPEECITPIILSLYEVYSGSTNSNSSVFEHLKAGSQILALRGPSRCSGLTFPIFVGFRVSDAHRALVFNQPSVFSTPDWITIPFANTVKTAHMHLIDILLLIPACIRLSGLTCHLKDFFARPIPRNVSLKPISQRTQQLLRQLQAWSRQNPHLCTTLPVAHVTAEDMSVVIRSPTTAVENSALMLPEHFVALASSTFKAAYMILTLVLHKLSLHAVESIPSPVSPPTGPIHSHCAKESEESALLSQATTLASEILDLSSHIEATHPVGFNFLRSVFPLVVVAMAAPLPQQRDLARQTLDRWGASKGLGGLCGSWGI